MRRLLVVAALLCVAAPLSAQSHFLRGDTNDDGAVDEQDLATLLSEWG